MSTPLRDVRLMEEACGTDRGEEYGPGSAVAGDYRQIERTHGNRRPVASSEEGND